MSMDFLDETDDWPEYETVREEIRRLEMEHAELQKALVEAESAASSSGNVDGLQIRVVELRARLREVQKKLDSSLTMYR